MPVCLPINFKKCFSLLLMRWHRSWYIARGLSTKFVVCRASAIDQRYPVRNTSHRRPALRCKVCFDPSSGEILPCTSAPSNLKTSSWLGTWNRHHSVVSSHCFGTRRRIEFNLTLDASIEKIVAALTTLFQSRSFHVLFHTNDSNSRRNNGTLITTKCQSPDEYS